MVRDTLLGFPSHALPYRYRKSYHFIDSLSKPMGKIGLRLEYQRGILSVLVWPMTTVPVMVRPVRLAPSSVRVTT